MESDTAAPTDSAMNGNDAKSSNKDALMASLMLSGSGDANGAALETASSGDRLFDDDPADVPEEPLFLPPEEDKQAIDAGALILDGGSDGKDQVNGVGESKSLEDRASTTSHQPSPQPSDKLEDPSVAASNEGRLDEIAAPAVVNNAASLLLAQSGLLSSVTDSTEAAVTGGGGGLFDDIDREDQEREEQKRLEEEELALKRKREEEARLQAAQEAARLQEEHRRAEEREAEARRLEQERLQLERERNLVQMQTQFGNVQVSPQQPELISQPPQYYNAANAYSGTPAAPVQAGFYRDHSPMIQQPFPDQQAPSAMWQPQMQQKPQTNYYTGSNMQQHAHPSSSGLANAPQTMPPRASVNSSGHQSTPSHISSPYSQSLVPNPQAGMHNVQPGLGVPSVLPEPTPPTPITNCIYQEITVTHPLLIQSTASLFGFKQAPHWTYQLTTKLEGSVQVWMVRRRFRHVVALEDRLRQECPGAILPPRPDKHATRALEEASSVQSTEFAVQRAAELQVYLNQLARHPIVHSSQALRLFLALQDDLGTAWPEVSSNALTRLANAGVGAAVSLSENASFWKESNMDGDYSEESAEVLALQSSESIRIGAVLQAVPKMQGAATLWREHAELMGAVGMELNRLSKEMMHEDREQAEPYEILANGMLRAGRRSKRCSLELGAGLNTFTHQYKLCRYEKLAFQDRKNAIIRRSKERTKADQRAAQLLIQQRSMYPPTGSYGQQPYGYSQQHQTPYGQHHFQQPYQQQPQAYGAPQHYAPGGLDRLERDAVVMDELAVDAERECEEIGTRLKNEVNRVAWQRRAEWKTSVKAIAVAMKESTSERLSIWESVRASYLTSFPELKEG